MEYSSDSRAVYARTKRSERRELGVCINGKAKATHGCRCTRCHLVHKHGAVAARLMAAFEEAPLCWGRVRKGTPL